MYLHEAGQFWPSDDMQQVGQTQALHLAPGSQWEGQFTVSRETNINRDQRPCEEDDGYSFTACMFDHVDRYTGCHLDWFGPATAAADVPRCSTREEVLRYNENLMWASYSTFTQIAAESGCRPKCKKRKFDVVTKENIKVTWRRNWSAAFFLEAKRTAFDVVDEYWAFDISDTLNGIGGVLGLFLGWSVYWILYETFLVIERSITKIFFNH